MKALNRLTTRRFPATDVYTIDQARELSLLSRALGRQLGMLIDRKGRVDMVLVGYLTGMGRDLMEQLGYEADAIYYLPNLRLRFVECGKARRELRFFLV